MKKIFLLILTIFIIGDISAQEKEIKEYIDGEISKISILKNDTLQVKGYMFARIAT